MKTLSDAAASAGLKILLVDDVPQGTVARKSELLRLGYEVETALDGQQAIDLLAKQSFDLMVTDFKMPGISGVELIARVRADYPATKIILLSALAEMLGFTEESSGADAVIAKSCGELTELTRTVKKLLSKRKPAASQKQPPLFMVKSS